MDAVLATRGASRAAEATVRFRGVQVRARAWIGRTIFLLWLAYVLVHHHIGRPWTASSWISVAFDVPLFGLLAVLVFGRATLVTEVRGDALHVRFRGGPRQEFPLSTLRSVETTGYYPAIDRMWGVQRGLALRIHLDCGDFVLVGTQRPDELRAALGFPPAPADHGA